jgi:hypothetical protein
MRKTKTKGQHMYIVVRNLEDGRPPDYKVFTASSNAVSLAQATRQDPYVRLKNGDEARVVGCKIYKAPTTDVREAIRMLEDGRATPLYEGHDWMIVSPREHYKTDPDLFYVDVAKGLSKDEIEKLFDDINDAINKHGEAKKG